MTQESTMKPFAVGDIFAGTTLLNNPEDDHAGPGRIIQYDSELNEKGVLWTEGTTHLVGGLKFGPDGNLWAFDSNAHCVLRISPDGNQLPQIKFADRSFSHCNFAPDGTVLMGEHLVGDGSGFPKFMGELADMGTTLTKLKGEDVFGYGHIFRFTLDGELIKEYENETHGGMTCALRRAASPLQGRSRWASRWGRKRTQSRPACGPEGSPCRETMHRCRLTVP